MNAPLQTTVERIAGVSMSEYRIRGSYEGVVAAFKAICDEYHPHGYGTRMNALAYGYDGLWEARVSRANSCE